MIAPEEFVADCRTAISDPQPVLAVRDALEHALHEGVDGLGDEAGIRILSCDDTLTVAHVVVPAGWGRFLPHDHRMWAVIGIEDGQEDNEFFRRANASLDRAGGRAVEVGDVLVLGSDVIHSIENPLTHMSLRALHVYGGNLVSAPRSMWIGPDFAEAPYDEERVTGARFTRD